jgi:hypothetical protein
VSRACPRDSNGGNASVNQEIRKLEHQVFAHCEIFIAGIEQVSLIAIRNANPAGAGFGRKKKRETNVSRS